AGAYDDAIRELEAAYELLPIADMQFNLGQAYRLKGEHKKALEAFKKAAEGAPDAKWVEEARAAVAALTHDIEVEEAEGARKEKRQREAEDAGSTLRMTGGILLVVGLACAIGGVLEGLNALDAQDKVQDPSLMQWSTDLDTKVQDGKDANGAMTTLYAIG